MPDRHRWRYLRRLRKTVDDAAKELARLEQDSNADPETVTVALQKYKNAAQRLAKEDI